MGFYHYSSGGPGRHYDPLLGRFLQADPVTPGGSQGLNRYAYGLSNPVKYLDSNGHWPSLFYALYEFFFGHGVSPAGGDLYDPTTGAPCGDSGCVSSRPSEAQVARGVAQDVVAGEVGGRVIISIGGNVVGTIRSTLSKSDIADVRHATRAAQSVLDGINPDFFRSSGRFGKAFYVAEDGLTATIEAPEATHVIRYQLDVSKARVLDLTDRAAAEMVGYVRDAPKEAHQLIRQRALDLGYNVIKFESHQPEAAGGVNYAILSNWDELLTPMMVSPAP